MIRLHARVALLLALALPVFPADARQGAPASADVPGRQGAAVPDGREGEPVAQGKPETPDQPGEVPASPPILPQAICPMIEAAAAANGLPLGFFIRLIWQESSFRSHVVSPAGAQGVAQFMPGTAAERGLADPFDPIEALPKSAELLRDLRSQFGNLGLAAAAYNAGPKRVQDWLAGLGDLPLETRNYVRIVTGRTAEDWAASGAEASEPPPALASPDCRKFAAFAAAGKPGLMRAAVARSESGGPWGVQIAGHFSQSIALAAFAAAQRRYRAVLGNRAPMIIRSKLRDRGARVFYRVRIGMKSRESAEDLCGKLRAAGGSCIVLRN